MRQSSLIFAVLLLFAHQSLSKNDSPDFIVQLFRHGARGPLNNYDTTWSNDQHGVLTSAGMRQQYILGNVLAQKYPQLFAQGYDYNQIYTISDTTPRCIQSATTQLYGMYLGTGPGLKSNYPKDLAIPPYQDSRVKPIANSLPNSEAIPYKNIASLVNVVDSSNAVIFQGDTVEYCPNVANWITQNFNDSKSQAAWKVFEPTINNINKYLTAQQKLSNSDDIIEFGDTMLCDLYDNRTMPGGFSDPQLIGNFTHAFTWFAYHSWCGQQTQTQLGAWNLVNEFLSQMDGVVTGTSGYKAALYSGHDDNIAAVLAAFGIVTEDCLMKNFESYVKNGTLVNPTCYFPYFASNIVIELYNVSSSPSVKFLFNNVPIALCNGQYTCSYADFVKFAKNATGNNTKNTFKQKCGVKQEEAKPVVAAVTSEEGFQLDGEMLALIAVTMLCGLLSMKVISEKKKLKVASKRFENGKALYATLIDNEKN